MIFLYEFTCFANHQVREEFPIFENLFTITVQIMPIRSLPVEKMSIIVDASSHVDEGVVKPLLVWHVFWNVS